MGKYLIILNLFLTISLWSQRPPYKEFNVDNGLPSNTVRCVFKDSKGLIWIGTQSGLVRYDGKNFFVFDESTGLVANEVWSIVEDGFGNLWLGTYGKGVVKYNGKSFTNYNTSNGLAGNKIRRVYYSKKKDRVFIGTENGLSIYNGFSFQNIAMVPNKYGTIVMDITEWNDSIYVTSYDFKMAVLTTKNNKPYRLENRLNFITKGRFLSSIHNQNQFVVATSMDGLQVFNNHFESLHSFGAPFIWEMEKGEGNDIYMASWNVSDAKGGLYKYDGKYLTDLTQEWKLSSTFGWSVFYDKVEKQLWLSTLDKGVVVINLNKDIEIFPTPSASENPIIYNAVFKDQYGRMWIGAQDNIYVYEHNKLIKHYKAEELKKELLDFAKRRPENTYSWVLDPDKNVFDEKKAEFMATKGFRVNQFINGNDGKLWVSATLGIFRLSKDFQIDFFDFEEGGHVLKTTNNKLIYSVTYSGMYLFPDIPRPDQHAFYSFFKSDTPRNLTRMIQNGKDIWFSSFSEGLFHWQEEGDTLIRKQRHFLGENFSDMDINKDNKIILNEKDGRIWIVGKYGDDSLVVEKKLIPNIDFNGTSTLFHKCFRDYLIIGTNKGINILKNDKVVYFLNYEEGLPSLQFKDALIDENNLLWVLSDSYLFSLNLNSILINKILKKEKIQIKSIEYLKSNTVREGNDLLNLNKNSYIKVPHNLAALEIKFYANDIYKGGKASYRYLVNGRDNGWSNFEPEGVIKVITWAPGKYQITLQGKNLSTGKFYTSTPLYLEILPPFWASLWFRLLMLLLLMGGIFLFARNRIKRIRAEEHEKNELQQKILETKMEALRSQMNPHFTFNALNSIQYYFLKNNVQEGLHFLTSFSKLIRQTVENASKESILLEEELDYIRQYIAIQQLRFPEIKLLWEISEEVDIHKTFLPPMILQPFIENIFEHAFGEGNEKLPVIEFRMVKTERGLEIRISDNGMGYESGKKVSGHVSRGIQLIEERIALLNTSLGRDAYFLGLTDNSRQGKGKGTEVLFIMPVSSSISGGA
jgi:ligand-binding sensor domain-containing protein